MSEHTSDHSTESATASPPWVEGESLDRSLQITGYGGPEVVGLHATGGIDMRSHRTWEQKLWEAIDQDEDVHLELARLQFIDARGASVLVHAASHLTGGHHIVVHHAPRCFQRVMYVLWPDGVPAITIERTARLPPRPSAARGWHEADR